MQTPITRIKRKADTMMAISRATKTSITMISTTIKAHQLLVSNPNMGKEGMGSQSEYFHENAVAN